MKNETKQNQVNVLNEAHGKDWSIYHADCVEGMKMLPDESVDLSIYSPPFCGMYQYSSSPRDLSNCASYKEFFEHYEYVVSEIARTCKPGRFTAVHCMDTPKSGSSATIGGYKDFPGDIIRLHEKLGFDFWTRRAIWKEPLAVRLRTMSKGLAHKQICDDATLTTVAGADYLLEFRKHGENAVPVSYPTGLHQTVFPSHSFEQYYQCVRRSWRFGQKRAVDIDVVTTQADEAVLKNLQRKTKMAEEGFDKMVELMADFMSQERKDYLPTHKASLPSWLTNT